MKDEDRPMGRLLSRREVLAYLSTAGAVWLAVAVHFPNGQLRERLALHVWSDQSKPKVPISSTSA